MFSESDNCVAKKAKFKQETKFHEPCLNFAGGREGGSRRPLLTIGPKGTQRETKKKNVRKLVKKHYGTTLIIYAQINVED